MKTFIIKIHDDECTCEEIETLLDDVPFDYSVTEVKEPETDG